MNVFERAAAVAALSLCVLCACGQKGALFLPDRAPQPVISPPVVPADVPPVPPVPPAATGAETAPTTRKPPRDPDPATAR